MASSAGGMTMQDAFSGIKGRLLAVGLAIGLGLAATGGFAIYSLRADAVAAHKARIKDLVDSARGMVAHYRKLETDNILSRKEAQVRAKEALRMTRFGADDYYFIYDFDGRAVMVASSPEIEGKMMLGSTDRKGFRIWDSFVDVAHGPGRGFVTYWFPRVGQTTPELKTSYIATVPEWQWIIGTGVYAVDAERQVLGSVVRYVLVFLGIVLSMAAAGIFVARSLLKHLGGETTGFSELLSDIAEFRESQQQVEHLAFHDRLTDLPNRVLLADRVRQSLALSRRNKNVVAICYLDLDSFKPVNDTWGHEIGDRLLVMVATRLRSTIRASDTAARLGGDEFVILLNELTDQSEVTRAVSRLLRAVAEPYEIGNARIALTMSIGVAVHPLDPADEPDVLIRHADHAMYEAKRDGKNRLCFFDPDGDRRIAELHAEYTRLVQAVEEEEFCLFYQPKVSLVTGQVVGVEALLRWQHPERGVLAPGDFLHLIESTELTVPLGEWIIREALRQRQRWKALDIDLPVSVNVFALHLQRRDFAERLRDLLERYPDVSQNGLELEIVETTVMHDLQEVSACLNECAGFGVRCALDDFGTGYSSLTYFRQLPVDHVKIDRSFVRDMLYNDSDHALVNSIIGMAHSLGRRVTAEGVETIEHGVPLIRCGCDLAQGYGIARPMPGEAIPEWLAEWRMPTLWRETAALGPGYPGLGLD